MNDRDKKLGLIVAILAIALLPYFLYIKPKTDEIGSIEAKNVELTARLQELQAMDANRQFYIDKTAEYNEKMEAIVKLYPADVKPENFTMFLLNAEYSSYQKSEEDENVYVWKYPFRFESISYGANIETPISAVDVAIEGTTVESVDSVETNYVGISNTSVLAFRCRYDALKYMLQYLMVYDDPMIYRNISMAMDHDTGVIVGEMALAQYAISGIDSETGKPRELAPIEWNSDMDGWNFHFGIDDFQIDRPDGLEGVEIRGNEELGAFGGYKYRLLVEGEAEPVGAGEAAEGEEGAEGEGAEAEGDAAADDAEGAEEKAN